MIRVLNFGVRFALAISAFVAIFEPFSNRPQTVMPSLSLSSQS